MKHKHRNIFVHGAIPPQMIAQSIEQHHARHNIGAHGIFLGQVRADHKPEGIVSAVEYTAYEEMALEKAAGIREELFAKYSLTCMHIHHSLGKVRAGELCLFVFTSSIHRKAALEALETLVEKIKKELPVWGREITDTGQTAWKVNT